MSARPTPSFSIDPVFNLQPTDLTLIVVFLPTEHQLRSSGSSQHRGSCSAEEHQGSAGGSPLPRTPPRTPSGLPPQEQRGMNVLKAQAVMNPSTLPRLAALPPSPAVIIWRWHKVICLQKHFKPIVHYAVMCHGTSLESTRSYKVVIIQYSTQPESSGVSLLFAESGGPEIIHE